MAADTGCNLHGWAFTHGCPGCDEADDRAIYNELRWRVRRTDWLPYRVAEFKGLTEDGLDMKLGPWRWVPPRRGPFASRAAGWIIGLINGESA